MTGRRGTLSRLEVLEDRERARVAAVEAAKEAAASRAFERLTRPDRDALCANMDAEDAGGAWWEEVRRAARALEGPPLEDPAGEAARAWAEVTMNTPEGTPYPAPPAGTAAYFEREAARCDTVKAEAPGEGLPEGVSLEAARTAACWSAAWWRYQAAYAVEWSAGSGPAER